jgi:hypothetical protein
LAGAIDKALHATWEGGNQGVITPQARAGNRSEMNLCGRFCFGIMDNYQARNNRVRGCKTSIKNHSNI